MNAIQKRIAIHKASGFIFRRVPGRGGNKVGCREGDGDEAYQFEVIADLDEAKSHGPHRWLNRLLVCLEVPDYARDIMAIRLAILTSLNSREKDKAHAYLRKRVGVSRLFIAPTAFPADAFLVAKGIISAP